MTQPLPTSLIIVSRHRAGALLRAITAVRQSDHPVLELIVVADPAAAAQVAERHPDIKLVVYDDANISAARNLGIARAAGAVVAFLDDDAVPEPTWASRLALAFTDAPVIAATGFVRGRNGISYQWQASAVDALGQDHPLPVPTGISLHPGQSGFAVKTQGTNCAFRRDALLAAGGFDPAFRFYLDEADLNLRLSGAGLTAIVPDAQVHHGYAASSRRRADRAPLSLHEIGASSMVFLRRHAAPVDWARGLEILRQDQRRRALRHMVSGLIEPRDVEILLHTLEAGLADGALRPLITPPAIPATNLPFLRLANAPRRGRMIAGRFWQHRHLAAQARAAVAAGDVATVLCLSPTALYHHHRFCDDGFWWQSGGLFGRADRQEPMLQKHSFATRVAAEISRLAPFRPLI